MQPVHGIVLTEVLMKIADFGVEMWLNEKETDVLYHLSETCANPMRLGELAELAEDSCMMENIRNMTLDYGDITGSERLKQAVCGMYETLSPENITAAHGGIGANALLLMTLIEPGDHIIAFLPTYQQLYSMPESIGAQVDLIRLRRENGWQIDPDELEDRITERTRAVCLNNPNNPTGTGIPDDTMRRIIEIARRHDLYLICDEVYRGLNYSGSYLTPSVADLYEKGIATGSMSKAFALAGIRFGWIAGPADIIAEINRHRDYHIISVGKIDDYIACVALENREAIFARNRGFCLQNLALVEEWIASEPHFSFVSPSCSTTCFVRFDFDMDFETFCRRLHQEKSTLLVPGRFFGYDDHFRLGFGKEKKILQEGLASISDWLRENNL